MKPVDYNIRVIIKNKPLLVEADDSGEYFILSSEMKSDVWIDDVLYNINVPAGFITDFTSVPYSIWPLIKKLGPWNLPSILHDYLYNVGVFDHLTTDRIFYAALTFRKVSKWRKNIIYDGLRLFSHNRWNEYRKE